MGVPGPGLDGGFAALADEYFFYFTIYSFLGWALEGAYNRYSQGTFRKEGFLKGPFKPMYGVAPLLLLAAKNLPVPLPVLLMLTLVVPSVVEYASGWLLETLFHRRWWDYSGMPYQLKGHICLKFSLYWWPLATACLYLIHPVLKLAYMSTQAWWTLLMPAAALLFAGDLLWTWRTRRRAPERLELEGN